MLTYVCPVCRAKASLEFVIYAAVDDAQARRLIEYLVMSYQPTLGADTLRYLRLHTPARQRLTWARVRKVLGEIVEAMRGRKVHRAGRDWPVTVDDWQAAYRAIFDAQDKGTLVLPLKDNAYLYAVLVRRVDKSEAIAEAKAEQERRSGPRAELSGHGLGVATSIGDALDNALAAAPAPAACDAHTPAAAAPAQVEGRAARLMREERERNLARRQRLLERGGEQPAQPAQEGQADA